MPQWAGSSWYFLRYMDPHCKDAIASKEALEYWSPVAVSYTHLGMNTSSRSVRQRTFAWSLKA